MPQSTILINNSFFYIKPCPKLCKQIYLSIFLIIATTIFLSCHIFATSLGNQYIIDFKMSGTQYYCQICQKKKPSKQQYLKCMKRHQTNETRNLKKLVSQNNEIENLNKSHQNLNCFGEEKEKSQQIVGELNDHQQQQLIQQFPLQLAQQPQLQCTQHIQLLEQFLPLSQHSEKPVVQTIELQKKYLQQDLSIKKQKFVVKYKNDPNVRAFGVFSDQGQITNNQNKKLEIASIVKLILVKTCLDIIQQNRGNINLNSLLKITRKTVGTSANLKVNSEYSVIQLISACLIVSGCQAAERLALSFGQQLINQQCGDNMKEKEFIKEMNKTAKQLGMNDTKIVDVTGLGRSTSTICDLNKLMKWVSSNPLLKQILGRQQYHSLNNSNILLSEEIIGKTGNGIGAKFCFAGYDLGNQFSIIVLGADERQLSFQKVTHLVKKMQKKMNEK